jgi:uncharacterized protein (DUF362 family)
VDHSRRSFFQFAAAGAAFLAGSKLSSAQQQSTNAAAVPPSPSQSTSRSKVALVSGDNRRQNIRQALQSIDAEIKAGLRGKKYVVIKPNLVNGQNQLPATHIDAIHGILDYLEPHFRGPVVVAESSAGDTLEYFDNLKYPSIEKERKSQKVSLVDLNREEKYRASSVLDYDLHVSPVRLAGRLFDPEAYVISCAVMKTHNAAIATLSVKNMVLGAPLHSASIGARNWASGWNDKRKFHAGIRQMQYNMFRTAEVLAPHWGLAVIDGYEGLEGNGPVNGTPVASRLAIASTDYIAADRVGLEAMGIDPSWVGYLTYCGEAGLGQYDLAKIDVVGAQIDSVKKKYKLHPDIEKELKWMGPMRELPPRMGRLLDQQSFNISV